MLLGFTLGAAVGAVLGLTGAGGGVLAVPALVLGLGLSLPEAAPIALVAVGGAAAMGCIAGLRRGLVRYRAAALMAAVGALCAPLGVWLAHHLPVRILIVAFCAVMVVIAVRMLRQAGAAGRAADDAHAEHNCMINRLTGRFRWNLRCSATLAGIGATAGLFTGMLGVGGGFLIVPAFRQFSDLTMQASAATSLAVIALVSSATVASSLAAGATLAPSAWAFIAGTAGGMFAGRLTAARLPWQWLQRIFAWTVLAVAAALFARHFV